MTEIHRHEVPRIFVTAEQALCLRSLGMFNPAVFTLNGPIPRSTLVAAGMKPPPPVSLRDIPRRPLQTPVHTPPVIEVAGVITSAVDTYKKYHPEVTTAQVLKAVELVRHTLTEALIRYIGQDPNWNPRVPRQGGA